MATHSRVLAWRIPRTEEPGGRQSMGSQRVRHDWVTGTYFPYHVSLDNKSSCTTIYCACVISLRNL